MSQGFLITGEARRRNWSDERKVELLAEAFGPGGSVTEIARREGFSTGLMYRWRQKFAATQDGVTFTAAVLAEPDARSRRVSGEPAVLVVEFATGARVRIRGSAPPALAAAVVKALS